MLMAIAMFFSSSSVSELACLVHTFIIAKARNQLFKSRPDHILVSCLCEKEDSSILRHGQFDDMFYWIKINANKYLTLYS